MKKEFSVKGLGEVLKISSGTLRVWISKGVEGEVYDSTKVNYNELTKGILRVFNNNIEEIEKLLECKLDEIEIVKNVKNMNHNYLSLDDLEENNEYVIKNYSFVKSVRFIKKIQLENKDCYIFENTTSTKLEIYRKDELLKDNIKIENI